jgi:excisionase family DNA binding protein
MITNTSVMTLNEVAEFLKVHPSTVYRLLKRHSLPAFKMGSDWRFNQESLEQWIKTCEMEMPLVRAATNDRSESGNDDN